jgi:amidase
LVPVLRQAYEGALKEVDILIMPTTSMKAMPIPENSTTAEYFGTALGMIQNTCPFDCTHHPAMGVSCVKSDGLPVGMMLIGRHFEEVLVLQAAHEGEDRGHQAKILISSNKHRIFKRISAPGEIRFARDSVNCTG